MIIIYSPTFSNRLLYSLKIIFSEVLDIPYAVTSHMETFTQSNSKKLNYSLEQMPNSTSIIPHGLLEYKGIEAITIENNIYCGLPVLFYNDLGDLPFDIFSAVFYLTSRYEEYLPYKADEHGRFEAEQSLQYKLQILKLPIVELWCKQLSEKLGITEKCSGIQPINYKFRLTIDVDNAWWFKKKGILRIVGSLIKELLEFRFKSFTDHIKVLLGIKEDPAFTFEYLQSIEKQISTKIQYFILCGKRGKYDSNISIRNKSFRQLIASLDKQFPVGIHPSYASNSSQKILASEIKNLSAVINHPVLSSRQHFLKLKFPQTYRNLISLGVKNDFTLGFASQTGFRAGIARPFNFFDLETNKETNLRLTPFQIMDRTQLSYQKLTIEEALKEYRYFTDTIKAIGGEFVCLWHNNSLSDTGEWQGWKKAFEEMIRLDTK